MDNTKDFIFLLGGYDLEMLEIKKLLIKYMNSSNPKLQVNYVDGGLHWGAGLSNYKEQIPQLNTKKIVGIELIEDFPAPSNYFCIDHHGENSDRPSSLEQVAKLLNVSIDRNQMLVAVNDRNYIPGLIEFGATKEEIEEIRQKDRKVQGVTEEDERLAIESIDKHLLLINKIIVVESLTPRFSAIADRLFPFSKLLIYDADSLNYYGEDCIKLASHFNQLINEKKAYYGGGLSGYFGITRSALSKEELTQIREQIISLISGEIV